MTAHVSHVVDADGRAVCGADTTECPRCLALLEPAHSDDGAGNPLCGAEAQAGEWLYGGIRGVNCGECRARYRRGLGAQTDLFDSQPQRPAITGRTQDGSPAEDGRALAAGKISRTRVTIEMPDERTPP